MKQTLFILLALMALNVNAQNTTLKIGTAGYVTINGQNYSRGQIYTRYDVSKGDTVLQLTSFYAGLLSRSKASYYLNGDHSNTAFPSMDSLRKWSNTNIEFVGEAGDSSTFVTQTDLNDSCNALRSSSATQTALDDTASAIRASAGSTTIYSGDGTLAGDREVGGVGHNLTFNDLSSIGFSVGNGRTSFGINSFENSNIIALTLNRATILTSDSITQTTQAGYGAVNTVYDFSNASITINNGNDPSGAVFAGGISVSGDVNAQGNSTAYGVDDPNKRFFYLNSTGKNLLLNVENITADRKITWSDSSGHPALLEYLATVAETGAFSDLTSTPTTAAGYGITNVSTVVAKTDILAQSTATTVVTYTAPSLGTYRIGGYVAITAVITDVLQFKVVWQDENNTTQTQTFFPMGLTSASLSTTGFSAFSACDIRVKSSGSITISTILTVGAGSITYDVGGNITRLY